ncbi:MAG: translation initiation factor IF-2 [Bacteroidaceae bacterium]|nr:translation initiation factor IF-2 [Bacteroidaceae bacterium]
MAIRIGKIARELNVGVKTIFDFLQKKGYEDVPVDNPNYKLSDEQENLLVVEFSQDKVRKEEAMNRMRPKQKSVETKAAVETVEEVEIKIEKPAEPVIKFKTVGKIQLDESMVSESPYVESVREEAAKKEQKPVQKSGPKSAPVQNQKPVKAEMQEKPAVEEKPVKKEDKPVEKMVENELKPVEKPIQKVDKPEQKVDKPVEKPVKQEVKNNAQPENAEPKTEGVTKGPDVFKLDAPKSNLNLKTVGKIDLSAINQSTRPKKKSKEEKRKEREAKEQQRQQQREAYKESIMKEISNKSNNSSNNNKNTGGNNNNGKQQNNDAPRKKNRVRIGGEKVDINKASSFNPGGGEQPYGGGKKNHSEHQDKQDKKGKGGGRNSKDHRHAKTEKDFSSEDVNRQIKETFSKFAKGKTKSSKYRKDKREVAQMRQQEMLEQEMAESTVLKLTEFVTANELATMMNIPVTQVIATCMSVGIMVSINQRLDAETINIVAEEHGFTTEYVSAEVAQQIQEEEDKAEDLKPRAPIVTVMGHVDHGKTSLLDYIRKANVIAGEAGGITQHIGAYNVKLEDGRKITFLDTPGHEAFTAMRARGAQVTDIAIIIVAADDNVMPQTKEAIAHATAAGVPIVFAINKVDKPAADPERIKQELAQLNFLVEDWGGKYQSQDISAKHGMGVPELMEKVLLEAEMLDLKANPNRKATGSIIESSLDKGRGYVATVLVSNGTLKMGDIVIAGTFWGKVKAMFNERNQKIKSAAPAEPVLILGMNGAPQAGVTFHVVDTEREAREITSKREQLQREQGIRTTTTLTLDELGRRIAMGDFHELNLIVKADVDGSAEALSDSLIKLSTPQVQVNVMYKAVGAISESDVSLAAASNAIIVGFNVRPSGAAKRQAEQNDVDIRIYSIIYDAIDEVKAAMEGLLAPTVKEEVTSTIEVLEVFHISKVGMVAGGRVREGKVSRNDRARVIRDGIVIHNGNIQTLKRYKDDVKEVSAGVDCGISLVSYNDLKEGDMIETYTQIEVKQTL